MMSELILFQIIQIALGKSNHLERVLTDEEWQDVLDTAKKQTVAGMVADAIERLPEHQRPSIDIKLKCVSVTLRIEKRSIQAFRDCIDLSRRFEERGFRCCVLKGQGNALAYTNPLRRQSGDIDLWIDGGRRAVIDYVKSQTDCIEARIHHVQYSEPDLSTKIELHYIPMFLYSFISQYRFEKFCRNELTRQMSNRVNVAKELVGVEKDGEYTMIVPTADFNAVFQMVHVMRHLFEEGIGLRQLVDYYHVLRLLPADQHQKVMKLLERLGLRRFAGGMMYVLKEVCGMEEELMLCPMDERGGKLLLREIMMAGNFGKYDERLIGWRQKSILHMFIWKLKNNVKYLRLCPSEVIWGPVFRIWHLCWRWCKGYV